MPPDKVKLPSTPAHINSDNVLQQQTEKSLPTEENYKIERDNGNFCFYMFLYV